MLMKPDSVNPASRPRSTTARSERVVATAARWIADGRRLDMQGLADELGVARVTLFRQVGGRDALLGQALAVNATRLLTSAAAQWEAVRPDGELHTPGTGRVMNSDVSRDAGLRRLLDEEPALTLRVLTDPLGPVQPLIVTFFSDLLRLDINQFKLTTLIEPDALAYALVRLGESFLYADVIAQRRPDLDTANRLQSALVEGAVLHPSGRSDHPPTTRGQP